MKTKLLLFLLLLSTFLNAQKIRWNDLDVRREVQPSLFLKENPIDVGFLYTSTDHEFFADQTMGYYVADNGILYNDFIKNDLGFPKLVAVLEYKYQPATLHLIKKDLKYQVVVVSHIYANLLLIDPEKGLFDVQEIKLGDCDLVNPIGNTKGFNSNLGGLDYPNNLNTTLLISDLSEFEANQYRNKENPNLPRKTDVKDVDHIQLLKLQLKVGGVLMSKFLSYGKYVKRSFNYLKEDKEFNGENFNKASELINNGVNPVDTLKVRQAIDIWKTEAKSISNLEDKKNKKYYIAIQENILQSYNVLRDFTETDEIASNLKSIDSKNEIADALISNKKSAAIPVEKKEIVYTSIPPRFDNTDLPRFLKKKKDMVNPLTLVQRGKFDFKLTDMSIYKAVSLIVKETTPSSPNFNKMADLIIFLAGQHTNYSQIKELDDVLKNYNTFCLKIADETKKFRATFDFKKEADQYIIKLRAHILSLHKIEEFTVFNDALTIAIVKTIEHTKPENIAIAQDFLDFETAINMRLITNTTKYNDTINRTMSNIVTFLDKKIPDQKMEVFFEFKNICRLIKENKKFSSSELINFSNTLALLYTYC